MIYRKKDRKVESKTAQSSAVLQFIRWISILLLWSAEEMFYLWDDSVGKERSCVKAV